MERILIADDDKATCESLKLALRRDGFEAFFTGSGAEVLRLCCAHSDNPPALLLLEPALPDRDGLEICKEIRGFSDLPIIIISARDDVAAKLLGLAFGADDYIVKPFDAREVMARIKAVLRRFKSGKNTKGNGIRIIEHDNLAVDMNRYEMKLGGKVCELPPKEIELLFHLASNPNKVFTRDQLLDDVWGFEYYGDSRTIDVHIKRLRTKLEGVSDKWFLKTVWGVGYKFELIENN
ncbi:MAG: response regulator transcription factor [Oscillospiraceae bacterium]|nr:response regulator transcription factor [Oscillospiraceae bacterium]